MANLDDRLRQELQRSLRPADPVELYEGLSTRHGRRRVARKVGGAALVVVVLAMAAGGFLYFNDMFRGERVGGDVVPGPPRIVIGRSDLELPVGGGSNASNFEIWSTATDGSDPRSIYASADDVFEPTVSPDGRSIAFLESHSASPGAAMRLLVMDADGSNVRVLATGISRPFGYGGGSLSWSPDGAEIMVLDSKEKGLASMDEFGLPIYDLAVIPLDGSAPQFIVEDSASPGILGIAWSPNGDRFAAVNSLAAGATITVASVPEELGAPGSLSSSEIPGVISASSPAWAPDGSLIAVVGTRRDHSEARTDSDIYLIDPDNPDSVAIRVTDDGGLKESVAWSQDGASLVYTKATTDGCSLMLLSLDNDATAELADRESLGGCPRSVSWQAGTQEAAPSPTATTDAAGRDLGLPFRLCSVSSLGDVRLSPAGPGRVWVGAQVKESGRCPDGFIPHHVVAADVDLDGLADTWIEMRCQGGCQPSAAAATDLNADGLDEVFVLQDIFSIASYQVVTVVDGDLVAATMAEPGHPEADLDPGDVAVLSVGGDEGYASWLRCDGYPDAPTIVSTWTWHPIEGPGSDTAEVHETRMALRADGAFDVLDTSDSSKPVGTPLAGVTDRPTCGVDLTLGL